MGCEVSVQVHPMPCPDEPVDVEPVKAEPVTKLERRQSNQSDDSSDSYMTILLDEADSLF